MNALERSRKIKGQLIIKHAFYGVPVVSQELVITDQVGTMSTNGKQLFVNPEFLATLTDSEAMFVFAHEGSHVAGLHHTRLLDMFPHDIANQAGDYAINGPLIKHGIGTPPEGVLYDPKFDGMSAEEIGRILMQERAQEESEVPRETPEDPQDEEDGEDDGQPSDESDEEGEEGDESQPDDAGEESGEGEGDDEGSEEGAGEEDSEGSEGESESEAEGEGDGEGEQQDNFGGCGEFTEPEDMTEIEIQEEENRCRGILQQAVNFQAAREAGQLPGDILTMIEPILNPRADWDALLSRYMRARACEDYSWERQNRRFVASGTYLPALHSTSMGPVAFVIDRSGSMPMPALNKAVGVLQELVNELQPEYVDVIAHNTGVTSIERFYPGEDIDITSIQAGGGTRFAPVIPALEEEDYDVAVWFTDMHAWDWDDCYEPGCPILFLDYANNREPGNTIGEEVIAMKNI